MNTYHIIIDNLHVIRLVVKDQNIVAHMKKMRHVFQECVNMILTLTLEGLNQDQDIPQCFSLDIHTDMEKIYTRNVKGDHIPVLKVVGQGHVQDQEIDMVIKQSVREQI